MLFREHSFVGFIASLRCYLVLLVSPPFLFLLLLLLLLLLLGVWAEGMIRQSLEVVPTVQPKYRLEEDARQAAEKRCHGGQQPVVTAGTRVERYLIVSCGDVMSIVGGGSSHAADIDFTSGCDGSGNEARTERGGAGVRLFSLLPAPELASRRPQTLEVLEAPRKRWKRIRRTVYQALLSPSGASGEADEAVKEREEDEGDETAEGDTAPRFSSVPLPEYENMACIILAIPAVTEGRQVAQGRLLDAPLHTLRYERTGAPKTGQGISTSWYSGLDVRSVGFKRSYIDDDDGAEEGDAHGSFSDAVMPEARQDTRKKRKVDAGNATATSVNETEATGGENVSPDDVQQTKSEETPVTLLPTSVLRSVEGVAKASDALDFSGVNAEDLQGLTASLLQQWASTGKAAVPFSEVARVVLKLHPKYTEMKVKHQSPETRQEAVGWFRVSQSTVRSHVLHLGYTIDSTNNVYLSQLSRR
ncbi:hypothetical protein TraAM80_06830 [Trypanosoma rangeli]|uniref:Uncharacterized protein n=1 Tax=Trypanosoma rangeli TaxID=5698 RepID=A0A3R7K8D4_TRYRA|nr:uncharacterized protein TraAM80_06830 [Trypanosoma rangeli]RNF01662.1 hypothetical protein TraAM80_06830 [Trypanosoma rangeli]|eukprot:RNF01662.1 hypothetical protein TraAM80_06830 [Trypanosoma rangeli]